MNQSSRYQSPHQRLSNRELALGAWYVQHHLLLRRLLIVFLTIINTFFWGYSLTVFGLFVFIGYPEDLRMYQTQVAQFQNYREIRSLYSPVDLQIGSPTIQQGDTSFDLVSSVTNPNDDYIATVQYHYVVQGEKTRTSQTVLLPTQSSYLAAFGIEQSQGQSRLVVETVNWQRLSYKQFADPAQYLLPRTDFSIDSFTYTTPGANSVLFVPQITFDLYNDTAYSFHEARFYVELLSGSQVIYVLPLQIDQFIAGSKRVIDLRPTGLQDSVQSVRLVPAMNLFSQEPYIQPSEELLR